MKVVLFFTKGVSIRVWKEAGMLDREIALYNKLYKKGIRTIFITYGDRTDFIFQERLGHIKILCNHFGFPARIYEKFIHLIHWKHLYKSDIIKTNQANGSDVALTSAKFWKKPLLGRMGYLWSEFIDKENDDTKGSFSKAIQIENDLFSLSNRIVVTTPEMIKSIETRSHSYAEKTRLIPNYVDTKFFAPSFNSSKDYDLIFIGRISKQQNVEVLLKSIINLNISILIIGSGELREKLEVQYGDQEGRIRWKNNVPNHELPSFLNRAQLFILPSLYEGHPKVLIEAMSCGLAVIGANTPGIRELINHSVNGWLCEPNSNSISKAIKYLLDNKKLCRKLGENARKFATDNFALDHIVDMELKVYKEILTQNNEVQQY